MTSGETLEPLWEVGAALAPGWLLGLMLVAALVGGSLAVLARIPRVVGYLLAGLALKYLVAWGLAGAPGAAWPDALAAASEAVRGFHLLSELALGMILFVLGSAFDAAHLRVMRQSLWKVSMCESGLTFVLVTGACLLAGVLAGTDPGVALVVGVLLGAAAMETAPATTYFVLNEYEAKGPNTDAMMTLTALSCLWAIVVFHIFYVILAATGALPARDGSHLPIWLDLILTIGGSGVLGMVLGLALSWLSASRSLSETLLAFFAALLALGAGAESLRIAVGLSFNFLLVCLLAGAVFANIAINAHRLESAIRTVGSPIFAAFFVLAGYQLHVDMFLALGGMGLVYGLFRLTGKVCGVTLGLRWSGSDGSANPLLGLGMLAQAGVAIGLAQFIITHAVVADGGRVRPAPAASVIYTSLLGSVVLFELIGPLLTRWVAVRCGEVKAIHLMRREEPASEGGGSLTAVLWQALWKLLGLQKVPAESSEPGLTVRHIMRTNAKCLHACDSFDDVLHFIERSRLNDFPVVDEENRLVGLIHFSDIRDLTYSPTARELITAVDLADTSRPAVLPDQPLAELLDLFARVDVSALPVVSSAESRKLIGLVEQRDLLRALHRGPAAKRTAGH